MVQNALSFEGGGVVAASYSADDMEEKKMSPFVVAVLTFLSVLGAAFLGLFSKTRLPSEHLQKDTRRAVGRVANLFVVMTSLVLGLMMNSAKDTFETATFVRWRLTSSCWIELCEPGSRGRP